MTEKKITFPLTILPKANGYSVVPAQGSYSPNSEEYVFRNLADVFAFIETEAKK